jgi:tRNA-dihydrouridine synthase 2
MLAGEKESNLEVVVRYAKPKKEMSRSAILHFMTSGTQIYTHQTNIRQHDNGMLRTLASVLTPFLKMSSPPPLKKVPIPPRGVDYRGKVVLAPMVRSGELPTRLLALKYGADLVWGPETIDKSMIGTDVRECPRTGTVVFTRTPSNVMKQPEEERKESVLYRLHPEREGKKLIFQMGTANPETAVQCARLVAPYVAGIDVNSGCPKPFSTSGGMGAALLKTPDKLCAILEALVQEITSEFQIGISVKIRLLADPADTETLVRRLCATGITGLTVHCRTTPMRPRERAIRGQLRMIADICRETGVACVMNGDVGNRDQALELIKEYGVDGAMIATTAEKNPSVFRTMADGGCIPWEQLVREFMEVSMGVENKWSNTKFMLSQLIPGKSPLYNEITRTKRFEDLVMGLGYEDMIPKAKEQDIRLRLTNRESPQAKRVVDDETADWIAGLKKLNVEDNHHTDHALEQQAASAIAV